MCCLNICCCCITPLSVFSLAITINRKGDVLSCITGSLPETSGSGGVPYLFMEVGALQPPLTAAANNTIPNGSNSNSNWSPRMNARMELWVVVIGSWSQ